MIARPQNKSDGDGDHEQGQSHHPRPPRSALGFEPAGKLRTHGMNRSVHASILTPHSFPTSVQAPNPCDSGALLAANPLEHLEASEETGGQGARYIDHDLSAEVAAMQRLPNLWAQKWGNVLESGRGDADTHGAKAMRMNTPTTSSPSSAVREQLPGLSNRPCSSQRTALDRLGFESAPLSRDAAAQDRAFQHGNGQSRACAQSSLIAALEAQARAVLAMCEALREESPV